MARYVRTRGGLALHQKMMHREAEERVRFSCGRCGRGLDTEGAKVNPKRTCAGGGTGGRRECGNCWSWITGGELQLH